LYVNLAIFKLHLVRQGGFGGRHRQRISVSQIKLRTMAWARNAVPVHFTIAKCAAIMRAEVFDTVDFTFHERYKHESVVDLHRLGLVW
jgi:GT2 family glycosyltransferase